MHFVCLWVSACIFFLYTLKVSIGDRNITHLQFADGIEALAEDEQELEILTESLDRTCKKHTIEC